MAFEKLDDYTNEMAAWYLRAKEAGRGEEYTILQCLLLYGEFVLKTPKFKSQRLHWRATIFKINQPFAEGYFKKAKH